MKASKKDELVQAVMADREEIVAFTKELIAIPSENPPGAFYKPCVDAISGKLSELEIAHEVIAIPHEDSGHGGEYPRQAVRAWYGDGEATLHFHGHYDVVPCESRDQFEPTVRKDSIYGRGSSDMKSGLAAMIFAIKAIRTKQIELNGTIQLTIVPDEETGGDLGSRSLADAGLLAADGVGMLTAEPTSGAIWNASRGAVSLLVTVKGTPMHVGLQHAGVNAFDNMIVVANALTKLKREVEGRTTKFNIQPEAARRSILMLGGRCEGGTNFNLVPGECSFTVDRRLNPEEDLNTETQRLIGVLNGIRQEGVDLDVEVLQAGESAGVSTSNNIAQFLAGNVERITGRCPEFEMCPGLLEIRFYAANGIPAFAYGPGLLSVSHGPNEFVPISNILNCTSIYSQTALDVLSV